MRVLTNTSINITETKDSRILKKKKKKREGKKPQGLTIFLAVIIVLIFKIIY